MKWAVIYTDAAMDDLNRLAPEIKRAVISSIEKKLFKEPEKYGRYLTRGFKKHLKLKVMEYRVIYKIEKQLITVILVAVGPRRGGKVYDDAEKRISR
jgi:mRNA interferase RelE/StbE